MLYNSSPLHIIYELKRKNYEGYNFGRNCVEIPSFKLKDGVNYITIVGTEGLQGRFFYATKEEIMEHLKPYDNRTRTTGHAYMVYAPNILDLHEIPIEQVNLCSFKKEQYDLTTMKKSKVYKDTFKVFESIIIQLEKNNKNINDLPLNIENQPLDNEIERE